jgi:hypothetical protein
MPLAAGIAPFALAVVPGIAAWRVSEIGWPDGQDNTLPPLQSTVPTDTTAAAVQRSPSDAETVASVEVLGAMYKPVCGSSCPSVTCQVRSRGSMAPPTMLPLLGFST